MRLSILLVLALLFCAFTYPDHVATKQDFANLVAMPEYRQRALAELQAIYDAGDATVTRVVSGSTETGDLVTEEIENPNPVWKQRGFASRDDVLQMIESNQ